MSSRLIQALCLVVALLCAVGAGAVLPRLLERSEEAGLRYVDASVENAPPWVAVGTAIGALRGLVVDVLWIKVYWRKQQGLFYEVMNDAELITKLQPRFAGVWAFHAHNMAYNISVATHTLEERWQWVEAGIRLLRNEGLRHNPNDLTLHKELAFFFAHKIEGYSDDAHLYYKNRLASEWHFLLGAPPDAIEDRLAWIEEIADAPESLDEAEARTPGVKALIERIDAEIAILDPDGRFEASAEFLRNYGIWQAVTRDSDAAQLTGMYDEYLTRPIFAAYDNVARDPELVEQWRTLVAYVRKRVLLDEYNMDPRFMARLTRELGPIDWRHGQAHALYWSRLGALRGSVRVADSDDVYKMLNNDRIFLQSLQGLSRWGRITFDPFSSEPPIRFPEPRFIDTIDGLFDEYYAKYYETRGAGGDTFIGFLQNFMSSAVREAYRSGEHDRAQALLGRLNDRFGTGRPDAMGDTEYALPLDVFVRNEIRENYAFQPHLAPSEAVASMRYAFRVGVGQGREDVYRKAVIFVNQVITIFKENEYYDFENKFGMERMAALMKDFPTLQEGVFVQLMVDPSLRLQERATIWSRVDRVVSEVDPVNGPMLRALAWDRIGPSLNQQLARHELGQRFAFEELFPPPPGLARARAIIARRQAAQQDATQEQRNRDQIESRGGERRPGDG